MKNNQTKYSTNKDAVKNSKTLCHDKWPPKVEQIEENPRFK